MTKKVLILKNDRTGDLFVSLRAINKIINKHQKQKISIFLSKINHKFSFLFSNIEKKIISMDLSILEKIKIFFYISINPIDTIYILSPKNFYYYLPLIFRNIKFYAITVDSLKKRPSNFLLKYLHKFVVLNRLNIKKRKSSYIIQENLIETEKSTFLLNNLGNISHNFEYPKDYIFFHYKKNLFENLLGWKISDTIIFLKFLSKKFNYILFSSELNDKKINEYFSKTFNTYNFTNNKKRFINNDNIIFLENIDGYDLFDAVNKSSRVISPEGIISHMAYYLKKPILALMHFNLRNRQDFINQIISCKEWFPPDNYDFIVLKKDLDKSLKKIEKRI